MLRKYRWICITFAWTILNANNYFPITGGFVQMQIIIFQVQVDLYMPLCITQMDVLILLSELGFLCLFISSIVLGYK